jgi:LysM repeat protein
MRGRRLIGMGLAAVLLLGGCSGDDEDDLVAPVLPTATATPEPTPTPTPTPTPEAQVHVVESGETLGAIAGRYDTTVAAIVEANDLADPDRLAIGDELTIPAPSP